MQTKKDFITQSMLDDPEERKKIQKRLDQDSFNHKSLAPRVLHFANQQQNGFVVVLQGEWGRGKTDVLTRIALETYEERTDGNTIARNALWLNPWSYKEQDLFFPLLNLIEARRQRLLKDCPSRQKKDADKDAKDRIDNLLQAAKMLGFVVDPGIMIGAKTIEFLTEKYDELDNQLIEVDAKINGAEQDLIEIQAGQNKEKQDVDEVKVSQKKETGLSAVTKNILGNIKGLLTSVKKAKSIAKEAKASKQSKNTDIGNAFNADPYTELSTTFNEMVGDLIHLQNGHCEPPKDPSKQRLIICIDDMDRCFPDKQVKFMEAIHFLTATRAPVIFVIALDPKPLEAAITKQYGEKVIDSKGYLDKIFSYRLSLIPVSNHYLKNRTAQLIEKQNEAFFRLFREEDYNNEVKDVKYVANCFNDALNIHSLRNPRMIEKISLRFDAFCVFLESDIQGGTDDLSRKVYGCLKILLSNSYHLTNLIRWLALNERWPSLTMILKEKIDYSALGENNGILGRTCTAQNDPVFKAFYSCYIDIIDYYIKNKTNPRLNDLPSRETYPDLIDFFIAIQNDKEYTSTASAQRGATDPHLEAARDFFLFEHILQYFNVI
ncbi:P-loop NTPase fold protein [Magnetococcales bacterium HHB-1]